MLSLWPRLRRARWSAAGFAVVIGFAVLAGRFWHPYYGFTKFIQLDEADAQSGLREVREYPVFAYEGLNGYDGAAYAQIAFYPLLDSPELSGAVGNVPYRARRILGSAVAWLLAGGNPARIANLYASLNLFVWLALAATLWRVLPVTDARSGLAWAGVIFSAGALHSVRLALTDLLATMLVVLALAAAERNRARASLALLGLSGLARETALLNVVSCWRGPWTSLRSWGTNLARAALVALPLALWISYVHAKAGPAPRGFGNFTWPFAGWLDKWSDTLADYARQPDFRWLNTTTLLATIALTVQAAYFVRRRRTESVWWRAGVCHAALLTFLGTAVWEGHPGAATRVLLPMSCAFAVLAVRDRASLAWITGGSLAVFSGVLALWHVPGHSREFAAGRFEEGAYVVKQISGWFSIERDPHATWMWASQRATLILETHPRPSAPVSRRVRLKLRAFTPRELVIRVGDTELWRGRVGEKPAWLEFAAPFDRTGRLQLALASETPGAPESDRRDARPLGFALYGAQIK